MLVDAWEDVVAASLVIGGRLVVVAEGLVLGLSAFLLLNGSVCVLFLF